MKSRPEQLRAAKFQPLCALIKILKAMKSTVKGIYFLFIGLMLLCFSSFTATAQFGKKKKGPKKSKKEQMYECGYVQKEGLLGKINPMKALKKGLVNSVSNMGNPDLGTSAISVFYQAHLHPQGIMRYPTKTPGWQTCGDAVFAGFTNRAGTGVSSTDGSMTVEGEQVEHAGMGTYFYGFDPAMRGEKKVQITSSDGDKVDLEISPAAPLEITSIDGKAKGEEVFIDGSKDVVIELANGDADPDSKIHVQLICKLVGTPVIYDVIVTRAKNTIYIPKEAFKNFEGSPSPFAKENTLIVNRVVESIMDDTDAGAIRTISAYMDWRPVTMGGDIAKGSIMTAGFDESKNTDIDISLSSQGEYKFAVSKDGPFKAPPVKLMKKVAVASFVIRGNLEDEKVTDVVTEVDGSLRVAKNYATKWFPEMADSDWKSLANKMYDDFVAKMAAEMNIEVVPMEQIVRSESYGYAKPIAYRSENNFVEVGAYGSKRILTTSAVDFYNDLGISFGADFVSQRLVNELDVDGVIAITMNLDFDFESEALDPEVHIAAFAPDVSYKTQAKYFSMTAATTAVSKKETTGVGGGAVGFLYKMIKVDQFNIGFVNAMKELSEKEAEYPVYEALWKAKF